MARRKGINIPKITQLPSGAYNCQLRIKDENGVTRSISITEDDYKTVEAKAIAIKSGLMQAEKSPRQLPTLQKAIENYIAERSNTLSPSTIRGYDIIKRTRFQAYMQRNLARFDERTCRRMVNDEAALCSPKTLKNAWRFVSSAIYAETGQRFNVPLPQEVKIPHKFLDYEQVKVFVSALRGEKIEIAALLALSSLRLSEILALDWSKVDLKAETIRVSGAVVRNEDNQYVQKAANKNTTSARLVKIFIPRLLDLLQSADKSKPLIEVNQHSLYYNINRICRENALPEVGIHGLRHSFASLAYHLQIPKEIAMEIGGWQNDKIMSEIYTHLAAADINEHRERLKAFYAKL